jgi:hypothetical protein
MKPLITLLSIACGVSAVIIGEKGGPTFLSQ